MFDGGGSLFTNVILFVCLIAGQYVCTIKSLDQLSTQLPAWLSATGGAAKSQRREADKSDENSNGEFEFKFGIGQVVQHFEHGQRGVIVGRDPKFRGSMEWLHRNVSPRLMALKERNGKLKILSRPWYTILIHAGDMGGQRDFVRYDSRGFCSASLVRMAGIRLSSTRCR